MFKIGNEYVVLFGEVGKFVECIMNFIGNDGGYLQLLMLYFVVFVIVIVIVVMYVVLF